MSEKKTRKNASSNADPRPSRRSIPAPQASAVPPEQRYASTADYRPRPKEDPWCSLPGMWVEESPSARIASPEALHVFCFQPAASRVTYLGSTTHDGEIAVPSGMWWVECSSLRHGLNEARRLRAPGIILPRFAPPLDEQEVAGQIFGLSHLRLLSAPGFPARLVDDALSTCTELEFLGLSGCNLRNADLSLLEGMTRLACLDLSNNQVLSRAGLERLAGLSSLRRLNLASCVAVTNVVLKFLAQLPELTALNLEGCSRLSNFQPLRSAHGLRTLFLGGTRLTPEDLTALGELPKLRHVDLSEAEVDAKGWKALGRLSHLETLSLRNCTRLTLRGLESVLCAPKLKHLDLRGCSRFSGYEAAQVVRKRSRRIELREPENLLLPFLSPYYSRASDDLIRWTPRRTFKLTVGP
ncbi:hypothetical protein OAX78_01840 [Planctomycetota bacterium]|nr:hypothetical protein [Planctomycetota bacterium]